MEIYLKKLQLAKRVSVLTESIAITMKEIDSARVYEQYEN